MAEAVAEKKKIRDDEFDIHGDLAVTEADDKSFVVLYDSSKENATNSAPKTEPVFEAPSLDEINETQVIENDSGAHPEDAYIDDILSSDDIETPEQTFEEIRYLRHLIDDGITVTVKLIEGEVFTGVIGYYDANFIRLTRAGEPNLFIFKHDIMYLFEAAQDEDADE